MLDFAKTFKIKVRSCWTVFKILLESELFAFKEFNIERRLSNIFKETSTILKSSYKVLPESPCFIFCYKIWQYVHCNRLLTRLWRHKFWNQPSLSNQTVFYTWSKSQNKTFYYLKELLRWNKKHFSSVFNNFQSPKIVSDLRVRL